MIVITVIIHPVRIARIRLPIFFAPRVGLPRNPFDRYFDGGAKILQGLGPKRRESWIENWVYLSNATSSNVANN